MQHKDVGTIGPGQTDRTLEALLTGDLSMMLYGVLASHQTRSYEQAQEVMAALLNIEPNEPMACVEDINEHYQWPERWSDRRL